MAYLDIDGERIFVADWGAPPAAGRLAFVFVHGAGMDRTVWALVARTPGARGHASFAVDLPGHGLSGGVPRRCIADYAGVVRGVVQALELDRPVLVGHSMGALIALEAGAALPAAGLVLIGAGLRMKVHPDLLALARRAPAEAAQLMVRWSFPKPVRFGAQPVPGGWLPQAAWRLLARAPAGVLAADLEACDAYDDAPARAAAFRGPVTVISGRLDRMTPPRAGRELASAFADGRFEAVTEAGHMLPLEAPAACMKALFDVMERLAAGGGAQAAARS